MKCVVIYFSLTGNTGKVARAIQTGVKQITGHCDILPIKEANPRRLYEYDLIGLGSPVMGGYPGAWWMSPPLPVDIFIKNMRFVGGKHIFSFCTHGTQWAEYIPALVPKLKTRGLIVIGWADWYGSSFGPLGEPTPYWTDGHPDEIDLEEAEAFGREMVWRSQRIYAGETSLIPADPGPPPLRRELSDEVHFPHYATKTPQSFMKFTKFKLNYHKEKCVYPKCRLCMENCPMDGIDLTVDPPVIGKPCMAHFCQMCDQLCPTGAIEVDEEHIKWQAKGDREAKHFEDRMQAMREREAQGVFRRLMPEDKFGWDTRVYQAYPKHPRYVIGKGRPYGIDPWSWRGDHRSGK
jgi:NAD-dependent dihydropyrimidine dehydrogenase PreA subunit